MNFTHVLPPHFQKQISDWLAEDTPGFDVGGFVVGGKVETAVLYQKAAGVLAGVPFFNEVFAQLHCKVNWEKQEGEFTGEGKTVCARVTGPACNILLGERVALNILARCSGTATLARRLVDKVRAVGYSGAIAGTRKTTPGFRLVEKYGMLVGGAETHRMDLSQMVMLKDNHIASAGGIAAAVKMARSAAGFSSKIEVECNSVAQATEAAEAGADIVMLDNKTPAELHADVAELRAKFGPRLLIEGSGGITEDTLADYARSGVDVISLGALSQGVAHIDFSLKIVPQ